MTGPPIQGVQWAAKGISSWPIWQEWGWLEDPSPALRPRAEGPGQWPRMKALEARWVCRY